MIFGEHKMGVYGNVYVSGAPLVESGGGIMWIRIAGPDDDAALTRADVERLRDLCDEALS